MSILSFLFETSVNILYIYIQLYFLGELVGYKPSHRKNGPRFWTFFVILVITQTIFDRLALFAEIYAFVILLIIIVYAFFTLSGSFPKKIFCSFLIVFIQILASTGLLFLGSIITQKPLSYLIGTMSFSRVIICYSAVSIVYFLNKALISVAKFDYSIIDKKLWIAAFLIPLTSVFSLALIMEAGVYTDYNQRATIYLFISSIGIIIVNVVVFILFIKLSKEYKNKTQLTILQKQLEHHDEIQNLYTQVQTIRHDFKNNLIYIQDCLEEKDYPSLEQFIEKLNSDILKTKKFIFTSSNILNSILNTKMSQATEKGIHVSYEVERIIPSAINEHDLSIILGNLLDNAITACEIIPSDKKIHMTINSGESGYHLEISNTITRSVLDENPTLKSSKLDKENHGFGLQSIKSLVQKNNGLMDLYESNHNHTFNAHIYFPTNE